MCQVHSFEESKTRASSKTEMTFSDQLLAINVNAFLGILDSFGKQKNNPSSNSLPFFLFMN